MTDQPKTSSHFGGSSGLVNKFHVERLIPSSRGVDHKNCEYFVLDPKHDPIARGCMVEYARIADQIGEKEKAADIFQWLSDLARLENGREESNQLAKLDI